MPLVYGTPNDCTGQCASNIASYLVTQFTLPTIPNLPTEASQCDAPVSYGPQQIRLLTKHEYANSIRDLTGIDIQAELGDSVYDSIPSDTIVNNFSNNTEKPITNAEMKAYDSLASKISDRLAQNNYSDIVDCTALGLGECGIRLADEWAGRVYRRPLSFSERNALIELFDYSLSVGDLNAGLGMAIKMLLSSPHFLYRQEIGMPYRDLMDGTLTNPQYVPASEFTYATLSSMADGTEIVMDGDDMRLPLYKGVAENSGYTFTGDDIIDITAKGINIGGFPYLYLKCGIEIPFNIVPVAHDTFKTYRVRLQGVTGSKNCRITNKQGGGNNSTPERYLWVKSIAFAPAELETPTMPAAALDNDAYILDRYELASFISYTFTGSTPDETLLAAAKNKALETDAEVMAQIDRLLSLSAAPRHFGNLVAQWYDTDKVLGVSKSLDLYPEFDEGIRTAMAQEVREIFNHVVLDEAEPFSALFDGDFTFVNGDLAAFYGIAGISGSGFQKADNLTERGGLLTAGAFLSVNAHAEKTAPIQRAVRLRRRALCHEVPDPPTGIDLDIERQHSQEAFEALLDENGGYISSRDEYAFLTRATVCAACHDQVINPLGFGFEDFNAVGLPQTQDYNGLTVDSSGSLFGILSESDDQVFHFDGALDFAQQLAQTDAPRECFIENMFRLAVGTGPDVYDIASEDLQVLSAEEKNNNHCGVDSLRSSMAVNGDSPRALLKRLGALDMIRYRKNWERTNRD